MICMSPHAKCSKLSPIDLLPCAQNPDPKAHVYFAEYITKAYQALTDEVSRQNYEKYGHPDGQQVWMEGASVVKNRLRIKKSMD